MVSDFNRQMKENKEKEFREKIKNNLFKKDSLKLLLEKQELSLHLADHINESPS